MEGEVTRLLARVAAGDAKAEQRLVGLVYDELKSVAARRLMDEPAPGTLTPTVLLHEAYIRVFRGNGLPLQNRRHLFFAFAQAMWRIVVERHRRKRLGRVAIDPGLFACSPPLPVDDILDLDEALNVLKAEHPREYEIAMLRKTLGLSIDDTAEVLGVSAATVKRGWAYAKAVLSRQLLRGLPDGHKRTHADQNTV